MRKSHPGLKGFAKLKGFAQRAADVARAEQAIQQQTDRAKKAQAEAKEKSGPMRASSQPYPAAFPPACLQTGARATFIGEIVPVIGGYSGG